MKVQKILSNKTILNMKDKARDITVLKIYNKIVIITHKMDIDQCSRMENTNNPSSYSQLLKKINVSKI